MVRPQVDRAQVEAEVRAAAAGDQAAFDQLVDRYGGLVWSVIRTHRLGDADAQDVFQATWLKLVENLDRLRDPRAVGGWLATTARREALRTLQLGARTRPVPEEDLDVVDATASEPDAGVLREERDADLWGVFERLDARCRSLLRVLLADPPPSYEEVSAALAIPVGSIGPTRGRCLARLRAQLRTRGISA